MNPRTKAGLKPHLNEWKYRKEKAATKVVEEMKRRENFQDHFDDDSEDDDDYAKIQRSSLINAKEATLDRKSTRLNSSHT